MVVPVNTEARTIITWRMLMAFEKVALLQRYD
jgi:hypothetical protein